MAAPREERFLHQHKQGGTPHGDHPAAKNPYVTVCQFTPWSFRELELLQQGFQHTGEWSRTAKDHGPVSVLKITWFFPEMGTNPSNSYGSHMYQEPFPVLRTYLLINSHNNLSTVCIPIYRKLWHREVN